MSYELFSFCCCLLYTKWMLPQRIVSKQWQMQICCINTEVISMSVTESRICLFGHANKYSRFLLSSSFSSAVTANWLVYVCGSEYKCYCVSYRCVISRPGLIHPSSCSSASSVCLHQSPATMSQAGMVTLVFSAGVSIVLTGKINDDALSVWLKLQQTNFLPHN